MTPGPPTASSPRDWRDVATTAAAAALLALFWWMAVTASLEKSQTSDELPHLGAGYVYDRYGDFRMQPENGNLPQRVFGLPALLAQARFPTDSARWERSKFWELSWDFFYLENNPSDWLLLCARALNALFAVALGALIFSLARAWHSRIGGLLALGFFAFAPNFLAHAALATSDMAGTLFLTVAPWLFWRHLQSRTFGTGLLAAAASGLALVAKHNGILLAPIYFVLAVLDAWVARTGVERTGGPRTAQTRFGVNIGLAALQAIAAVTIIWAFFNFRYAAAAPGQPAVLQFAATWDELFARLGAGSRRTIETALAWKLLPQAWLYGLTHVLAGATRRLSYFAGEHSLRGWWQFFPALFLTKTTLAMLAALTVAAAVALARFVRQPILGRRVWLQRYAPFATTALIVWLAALTSSINVGDRHILAVYPVLFLGLGVLATPRTLAGVAALLLGAHAFASWGIRPHYLAAFNRLAGGPEHAHRLVVDSSLDWGQDLPALQKWLTQNRQRDERFYLGYFGNAWPPHYGVKPNVFLTTTSFVVAPPLLRYDLQPGIYALSATVLEEAYSTFRGPWTADYEEDFRALHARFATAADHTQPAPGEFVDYARYNALRLSRLCKYLQRREPEGYAGYSILLFRLTPVDIRAVLDGPVVSSHRIRTP